MVKIIKITKEETKSILKDKWYLRNISTKHHPLACTHFAHMRAQILLFQTSTELHLRLFVLTEKNVETQLRLLETPHANL